jgi:hypothetical protein
MGWSLFRKPGLTHHDPARAFAGYTVITPLGGDCTYLIDMDGRVVHRWRFEGEKPEYAYLTDEGRLVGRFVVPYSEDEPFRPAAETDPPMPLAERVRKMPSNYRFLREVDWEGRVVWEYDDPLLHHDIFKTRNDSYIVSRFAQMTPELSRQVRGPKRARRAFHPLLTDEIMEVNRAGEIVWSVRLDEVLDPRLDPIGPLERRIEWSHTNSVCESADGTRVLISCKNINRVAVIDKATKQLTWRFGHPVTSGQHHARWLENGNVHIFDNGLRREGLTFSRIIEVEMETQRIVREYQANPPFSFYSPHISSADRLPNDNTLICEGVSGRIFEVTREGETVWEWHNPFVHAVRGDQLCYFLWRAHRYAPDHPALRGRSLDPERYRELNEASGLA